MVKILLRALLAMATLDNFQVVVRIKPMLVAIALRAIGRTVSKYEWYGLLMPESFQFFIEYWPMLTVEQVKV